MIGFDGRIAIVTGAGGGLGRTYALELARRGARVVVNDPGGARDGRGGSDAAQAVVEEIRRDGGVAVADTGSVVDPAQMAECVARTVADWGAVHILMNNAGILRDRSFAKMTTDEWRSVVDVHLTGSAIASRAVWNPMREQGHGRILMTTSSAGLFGHFGQANYAAAKLGVVGLARTLHIEGMTYGIRVNSIAPLAATRMTEGVFPPATAAALSADDVAPAALFLVSDDAPSNRIVAAGGGVFHGINLSMTAGCLLPPADRTPEGVAAHWAAIEDRSGETTPDSASAQSAAIRRAREG